MFSERNKNIYKLHKLGERIKDIAKIHNISVTRVRSIIDELKAIEIKQLLLQKKEENRNA